jgi:hypothetical protein
MAGNGNSKLPRLRVFLMVWAATETMPPITREEIKRRLGVCYFVRWRL